MNKKIICSIGVCVYNEEENIGQLLHSILSQKLTNIGISDILVIASGSTDGTCKIVKAYSKTDKRLRLIKQKLREGKASAVNLFIQQAKSEVLVLLGGDVILSERAIEQLVGKFADREIGMTGARPIPVNNIDDGVCGFAAHVLWELHHRVSLKDPKMGEVIAFRKIFKRIPVLSSVDEANIEPLIRGQGYKIIYVPQAKVYNKAPMIIHEFIAQRRRIYCGHLAVKYEQSYEVSTMNYLVIFRMFLLYLWENPRLKFIFLAPLVILLEGYSRMLGWWDYRTNKKKHIMWERIDSTKILST